MNSFIQRVLAAPKPEHEKMMEVIKKMIPGYGKEVYGDMIAWHVSEYQGVVRAHWEYTFRRDSRVSAWLNNRARIEEANRISTAIRNKFPKRTIKLDLSTLEDAKRSDRMTQENGDGDGGYSEYEQALGGGVDIKVVHGDSGLPTPTGPNLTNAMFVDNEKHRKYLEDKFDPWLLGTFRHLRFRSAADYAAAEKWLIAQGEQKGAHFGPSDGHWDSDAY